MKERYAQQPAEGFTIDVVENIAIIAFRESIVLVDSNEDGEVWEADKYVLTVPNRDNLPTDIEGSYEVWLAAAKDIEAAPQMSEFNEREIQTRVVAIEETIEVLFGGVE